MNRDIVAALVQSVAERARTDSGAVVVEISVSEKRALEWVAQYLRTGMPSGAEAIQKSFELNLEATRTRVQDADVLLCLDFGTATSKAFARRMATDELLPLHIGSRAGQTEPVFGLTSSMFITSDGRLLFGQAAVNASHAERSAGRSRIDSIKDILAKGHPKLGLGADYLPEDVNPSGVALRYIDVLSMYLGYLTDVATTELAERYSTSRYVRRRMSLPAFESQHAAWATTELRKLMANAQILADTFHGRWDKGLALQEVRDALDALRTVEPPLAFVDPEGVTEPVAAVASRTKGIMEPSGRRELFAVIDVGAGTIDFALFLRMAAEDGTRHKFFLIPGSQKVLRQAGNQIDHALASFILSRADVHPWQSDFRQISTVLSQDSRQHKEALFRGKGSETFTLQNDKQVKVNREEFLSFPGILQLKDQIDRKFTEMLEQSYEGWIKEQQLAIVVVLLTGGGADLPIVRSLSGTRVLAGRQFQVRIGKPRPEYIERDFGALSGEYPQLAVALGGSSRELPELLREQFASFGGSRDSHVLETVRKGV